MNPSHDVPLEPFLDAITPSTRQRDARTMVSLMSRVTGLDPLLWDSIVGFGEYHYEYASGRQGDAPAAAFAPRKAATVVYLPDGISAHASRLERLGAHTSSVGCLYMKDLEKVDLAVLEEIIAVSFRTVTSGTFGQRARDGGSEA